MERRQRWTLVAAVVGSGMVFLDSTVVTVAVPRISRELPATLFGVLEAQSYIYSGYLLTLSALLILGGALADYFGRRRVFALGLAGFGLTSALCGLSWSMESLIAFRILQGAAGALLVPGSLSIITDAFDGEARGRAFGVWAAASAATTIVGPLVGGVLVDSVSWRAVFFLNLPLVAVGLWATLRHARESRDEDASGQFDWLGAAVVALAVGGLVFGAIRGQEQGWQTAGPFVALAVGVAATIALPVLMTRRAHPLVPPELFASRNFTVTNTSTLLIYGGLYVVSYFLVLFLQGTLGYNATAAGIATVPMVVFLALFSPRFGALAGRYGPRWFMAAGPALMAAGVVLLSRVPATSTPWRVRPADPSTWLPPQDLFVDLLPGLVLFGLGLMVVVAPLTTALMNSVPQANTGVASAVNNALSRVGPQLATAVLFVAISSSFYTTLAEGAPGLDARSPELREQFAPLNPPGPGTSAAEREAAREASTQAFSLAMLVAAALIAAGGVVNAVGIRNPARGCEPVVPPEILPGAVPPE
jgi:EmrB/QacA subfamily drug resistance transporter